MFSYLVIKKVVGNCWMKFDAALEVGYSDSIAACPTSVLCLSN